MNVCSFFGGRTFDTIDNTRKSYLQYLADKTWLRLSGLCLFLTCFLIVSLSGASYADTYVNENITEDAIWTMAGSPYIVAGDIYVRSSNPEIPTAVLTIEAGVIVKFESVGALNIGVADYNPEDILGGALRAQGTETLPILFTSSQETPQPGDWGGIYFGPYANDDYSVLEYCTVEYASIIEIEGCSPTVINSTVQRNNNGMICSNYIGDIIKYANPIIQGNQIVYNNGVGITCCEGSSASIVMNTVSSNMGGIGCWSGDSNIKNNTITNNPMGGFYCEEGAHPSITGNIFSDNGVFAISTHPDSIGKVINNTGSGIIEVRQGTIYSDNTLFVQELPFVFTGNVTVGYYNVSIPRAALFIEPGVIVRFEQGTSLIIDGRIELGNGCLYAQGTVDSPIVFTSNSTTPSPGDWGGIQFLGNLWEGENYLEHCVVEYAGYGNNANIYLYNASPTIKYNNIRYSSHSGIYLEGNSFEDSTAGNISCNNINNNNYGIYLMNDAMPTISTNNITDNSLYAIYNAGTNIVSAENNWWGDSSGPGQSSNAVFGNVDYDPWLSAECGCMSDPPTNLPPNNPSNPDPADGAVDIDVSDNLLNLDWTGGDPNLWDTVQYDVYFGSTPDNLVKVADGISSTSYQITALDGDTTYYWQIVSRDSSGEETSGIVWDFITEIIPSDLIVESISRDPSGEIQVDQAVTFGAIIKNIGQAPMSDWMTEGIVEFFINEQIIETFTCPILDVGESYELSSTWTAPSGDYIFKVVVDGTNAILESDDENNSLSITLPHIIDPTPPSVENTSPSDGSISHDEVNQIVIAMSDQYGSVNDSAVIASIAVTNSSAQSVSGTVTEENDIFTFIPDVAPLPEDTYQVAFDAIDMEGNSEAHIFSFTIDYITYVSGNISTNTTWTKAGSPYVITGNLTVDAGRTLTIEPGVVAKFEYGATRLIVNGTLIADGTPDDRIYFTSIRDDSVGGDTNGDGSATSPGRGLWDRIVFNSSSVNNVLDNVEVRYAGYYYQYYRGLDINTSSITVSNSTISYTQGTGIYIYNASPTIQGNFIRNNSSSGIYLYGTGCNSASIDCNNISSNSYGVYLAGDAQPLIHHNNITGNSNYGTYNSSSVTVAAENNWWNSSSGPNTSGADRTYGSVDADPWLGALCNCNSTPPALIGLNPSNGANLQQVNAVVIALAALYEPVDDTAVINSITVLDGSSQSVSGTVAESSDTFTFTPDTAPMPDDTYTFSFISADTAGNSQSYSFSFTVDSLTPAAPVITGSEVTSGTIQVRPAQNSSTSTSITLTGTREDNTGVYINSSCAVETGTGDWSAVLTLTQGTNALEIWCEDSAGNRSESVWVDILVDSVAPAVASIAPANNSLINTRPTTVVINYTEAVSGLDLSATTRSILNGSMEEVLGTWSVVNDNQLVFTPFGVLADSAYTINVQLRDNFGNIGSALQYHFTLDTTPPSVPVVNPVTSPTYAITQVITGTKDAYANILLNGSTVVSYTSAASWQHIAALTPGVNQLVFASRDQAGNTSESVTVEITFDDIAPLQVDTLTINNQGNGTTLVLDWTGYDETAHGDVASYRVYVEAAPFSDVTGHTPAATRPSGTFAYTASNLTRGATYYCAVVAVDQADNFNPAVSPVSAVPVDIVPPENVTGLSAAPYDDHLLFTWTASANTGGDLANYKVYFNGAAEGTTIASDSLSYDATGLSPASAYTFKVTAVDNDGNESTGAQVTGYTLLDNPVITSAEPYSGYVDLAWSAVTPSANLQTYRVYTSTSDFTSVEGMSPSLSTTSTSIKVAGLTNNTPYFFAVTAVNKSGGQRTSVTTISATPVPDTFGPEVTNLRLGGTAFSSGSTMTASGTFTVSASDPAGVARVEFALDGTVVATDYSADYTCYLSIVEIEDGTHTLTITAYDTLGNSQSEDFTIIVALAVPAAPTITQPSSAMLTNNAVLTVAGSAPKQTTVTIYNNSASTGVSSPVSDSGAFTCSITLTEGENHIQALATNRAGDSPLSAEKVVTLDTTLPACPANVTAQAKSAGQITLSWRAPADTSVKGYNLYRSTSSITEINESLKVNTNLITATSFTDLPATDGTYFYRLTTISQADNASELSAEVSAVSDRTRPSAAMTYTPHGAYDQATGRMAPGTLEILVTVSEPLMATPFVSIVPLEGVPTSLDLTRVSDTAYTGYYTITELTPTGTACALFSGRDMVGNQGTEITTGETFEIDTDGPTVGRLEIQPAQPVKNDETNPVSIIVTLGLDEEVASGTSLDLSYLLSGEGREAATIENIILADTAQGDAQTWQAMFTLPADAGLVEAESLSFMFEAEDDLGNIGSRITAANLFQVYQGELPPLDAPGGLTATSLPAGEISLSWNAVEEAIGYMLFRKAPGEESLSEYQRIDSGLEIVDAPTLEGLYTYAVTSIRAENGQESLSAMSAPVEAASDATAPDAPSDLALTLVSQGIRAQWTASASAEPLTYSLYRSDATEITSVDGLTPFARNISQVAVIDPNPSNTDHCYVVTAVDAAGNISAPSNSFYLNFDLLPVSSISVVQSDESAPVVSWTHPGGVAGYDFYLGPQANRIKMNTDLMTGTTYTDTGYTGDERTYTIIAVDDNQQLSLERSITLPVVTAVLAEGSSIRRGIMNSIEYTITNSSAYRIEGVRLNVEVENYAHTTQEFSIEPLSSATVPVVVGGYEDLPDVADLNTAIDITPAQGEHIRIERTGTIDVGDGMLSLSIENDEFIRGGTGSVRFILENTGEEEIEIITATSSGSKASNEIRFYMLDADGNVLTTKAFTQAMGDSIVALSNGNVVARIPAGAVFTSAPMSITVPANAPDDVTMELSIAKIYFHQNRDDQVVMDGLRTTQALTLADTAYYGEVTNITPETSTGNSDIVIQGRAIDRTTGETLGGVPLNLVITLNGFERSFEVYTDTDGTFTFTFDPLANECGIYKVRAMHPDRLDKPLHGQFVITRVGVNPTTINFNIPRNYEKAVDIRITTGDGTELNNLRMEYNELDQSEGVFPAGVHVTLDDPVAYLGSSQNTYQGISLWADNTADEAGTLIFKVASDENTWATIRLNYQFTEANPVLNFTPNHLETGVAREKTVSETITLKNNGLAALEDVNVSVLTTGGSPVPSWVLLNSVASIGDIAVGSSRQVNIAFSPTAAIAEGIYHYLLRVNSSNYPQTDINLYCSVTQSGIGSALFKVADIYTGTMDKNNVLIQGLSGAHITLQNEKVINDVYYATTDSLGEAMFTDIAAGTYKFRATASNHQEQIGRIWIRPGVTATQDVFLSYNLVTVEWEVVETVIEDTYEIVLNITYETDVPAPVVVIDPSSVSLPDMHAGDVFNGEISFTNYGLITAQDVSFTLPRNDQYFRYELMAGIPDSIKAKERITVPYKITCITSPFGDDEGTGGGCVTYTGLGDLYYYWVCINGNRERASARATWSRTECTGGSTPTGSVVSGGTYSGGGGTGGGSSSGTAPSSSGVSGTKCLADPPRQAKDVENGIGFSSHGGSGEGSPDGFCPIFTEGDKDQTQDTGSSVNLIQREYNRDAVDLSFKVPGGTASVVRRYYNDRWYWSHESDRLIPTSGESTIMASGNLSGAVPDGWFELFDRSIDKGGVIYSLSSESEDRDVFVNGRFKIEMQKALDAQSGVMDATGYVWRDWRGYWREYDAQGRITAHGDRLGITVQYVYDNDLLTGITDRDGTQVIWYEYGGGDSLITAVQDSEGRRVTYEYDAEDLLTGITGVLGEEVVHTYDDKGRITGTVIRSQDTPGGDFVGRYVSNVTYHSTYDYVTSVLDDRGIGYRFDFDYDEFTKESYAMVTSPSGMVKEVRYDRNFKTKQVDIDGRTVKQIVLDGRNQIVIDENGYQTRYEYDEWNYPLRVVYPDGTEVRTVYESTYHRPVQKIDERGIITEFGYDQSGNMILRKQALGTENERTTEYTYDADGNQTSIRVLGDAFTTEALTVMTYDVNGNMTTLTDPEGGITTFTYDYMGNMLTREDARDKTWTYTYDRGGRMETMTDPLERTTQFFYDAVGRKIRQISPDNQETSFTYDLHGNMLTSIDASGAVTAYEYNADGKLIRQADPEGKVMNYEYDTQGRLIRTIDGSGNETIMDYDGASGSSGCSSCTGGCASQVKKITYPTFSKEFTYDRRGRKTAEIDNISIDLSYAFTYAYDDAGNLIEKTDKEGRITAYEYDALNRLVSVTDPASGLTQYAYDNRDNLVSLTDAEGSTTSFEYDRNNRLVKETRPMSEETVYTYDAAGNLISKIDAMNQKIEYTYDDAGRLTETRYYEASDYATPVKTVAFTYDMAGNLTGYDDGETSAVYTYDDNNRKLGETIEYGAFTKTFGYTYYNNSLKQTFTDPAGTVYSYTYDANNQLSSVQVPGAGYITYTGYTWNRPSAMALPGGSTKQFNYDPLMRLTGISVKDPAANPVMDYSYTYDRMDNITDKATGHGNYAYGYDDLYRLSTVDNPSLADEAYTYDNVGNRLTSAETAGAWGYTANNELTGYDDVSYEYDANGNMVSKTSGSVVTNYIYNIENRLARVEDGSGTVIAGYYYDPFGRRLWKEISGVRTYFCYADEGLVAEFDASGNQIKSYGYRPGSTWTTDPLFMEQGGQYYFYHNDHLGTPQQMTSTSGAVVWAAEYSAFLEARVDESSSIVNNLRAPGQYYDGETGLHYNFHRYYDPSSGRYTTTDPVGWEGGINLYVYVENAPIIGSDPAGLFWPYECAKCIYYGHKISKNQKKCEDELGPCPTTDTEELIKFIEKYGGGYYGAALWNCVSQKDPNLYIKWGKACFKCGFLGGPKPSVGR